MARFSREQLVTLAYAAVAAGATRNSDALDILLGAQYCEEYEGYEIESGDEEIVAHAIDDANAREKAAFAALDAKIAAQGLIDID